MFRRWPRLKNFPRHVGARIGVKRHFRGRDAEIGQPRVKHAETVVVLRGEDDIFHGRRLSDPRPLLRIEFDRVEGLG